MVAFAGFTLQAQATGKGPLAVGPRFFWPRTLHVHLP